MLTQLQQQVARAFTGLPESSDFALAGAAALIVRGEVERTTRDLDYFATSAEAVAPAVTAAEQALADIGLTVERIHVATGFARLRVRSQDDECLLDLAHDFRLLPPEQSELGPTLAGDELAADKVLALFGRAQARDFVDVFFLARAHGRQRLLELARLKDHGFERTVFSEMLRTLSRLDRQEFEVDDATLEEMRSFYDDWVHELNADER